MELITLVERATQGDARAVDHLMTQHWRFVYAICLSQVGHAAEAEDLTQEVFVRMSHDLVDLRAPDKFLPCHGTGSLGAPVHGSSRTGGER